MRLKILERECLIHTQTDTVHKIKKYFQVQFYRFSLSWARIVPTGRVADGVNQAGIDHYNRLIDALLTEGIQPFVTLYHWDLPMPLTEDGSWLNDTISTNFRDYARIGFEQFGDRVKLWLTFNEPHVFCQSDWQYGEHEPFQDPPVKPYVCAHNVVKAHALAYRLYDEMFRQEQNGKIGITLNCDWPEPKDLMNATHVEASDRSMHFHVRDT
jgi:beta-glucosidase/6-phospho-beta-glucosidase/beta-galactosidase